MVLGYTHSYFTAFLVIGSFSFSLQQLIYHIEYSIQYSVNVGDEGLRPNYVFPKNVCNAKISIIPKKVKMGNYRYNQSADIEIVQLCSNPNGLPIKGQGREGGGFTIMKLGQESRCLLFIFMEWVSFWMLYNSFHNKNHQICHLSKIVEKRVYHDFHLPRDSLLRHWIFILYILLSSPNPFLNHHQIHSIPSPIIPIVLVSSPINSPPGTVR